MSNPKYILINSKFRSIDSKSSTNFRIYFNKNIEINKYLKINYLNIPRCNYLITNKNNSFSLTINGQILNVIIPIGNYTPLQLADIINVQVNNLNNFNITYNNQTFKYTFTSLSSFKLDLTISDFHKLLSLEKKVYNSIDKQIVSNIIFFNYPLYLNMRINNISSNNFTYTNENSQTDFIINCGSDTNFGEIIQYKGFEYDIKMFLNNINVNYFDIQILDDENEIFDNNNFNWYAVLEYQ